MSSPIGTRFQRGFYWLMWFTLGFPWTPMFRWRMGFRDLPKDRPYLLIGNHTSAFDPVWLAYWIGRRASFMASSHLFRVPVLGTLLPYVGAFPKAKFIKDRESMQTLADRFDAGEVVVLFPEGMRSWDGRPRTVLPGIGRLVKRLDATVVVGRILTGHMFQPRWARYPRWVRIEVEHEVLQLDSSESVDAINARIQQAIEITVDRPAPSGSFGWRMAHGLPQFLWACPACFEVEALQVHPKNANAVKCAACGVEWRLDVSNRMLGDQPTSVHEAADRMHARFGAPPVLDRALFEAEAVVIAAVHGRVLHLERGRSETLLASGPVKLTSEMLEVGELRYALAQLDMVSVEVKNEVTFRQDGRLLKLDVPGHSPLKWGHFLKGWFEYHRQAPSDARSADG